MLLRLSRRFALCELRRSPQASFAISQSRCTISTFEGFDVEGFDVSRNSVHANIVVDIGVRSPRAPTVVGVPVA